MVRENPELLGAFVVFGFVCYVCTSIRTFDFRLSLCFVLEKKEADESAKVSGLYCQLVSGFYFGTNVTGNTSGEVSNG